MPVDVNSFPRGVPGRDLRSNIAPFAAWIDPFKIAGNERWAYKPGRIFLGEFDGNLIGFEDNRHMMTVAGSRAGKGVSTIIPNLLEYPGSVLVIDPKGENAKITGGRRGAGTRSGTKGLGQAVYFLDPFGTSGRPQHSFNPLDAIDIRSKTAIDDAGLVAEGLVIQETGNGRHFSMAARNFLRGLVLFVCSQDDPAKRNLVYLRQLLTADAVSFKFLLQAMKDKGGQCDGLIARAADTLASKDIKEASSVISSAIEQTEFLDSPLLADSLRRSDFKLTDLKLKNMTVYLCLPASRMATHNRWLRIIINMALQAMESEPTIPKLPVIFLMDEFAVLDHMESIEKAAGQIAGLGVRLWPILQDLSQIQAIYKDRWETFVGNAGLLQFFGNNDLTTLKYISERLGKTTIMQISKSEITHGQVAQGFKGESTQLHAIDLMTPDEVGRFFSRQQYTQVILWPGANPIAVNRVEYFSPGFFQNKYDT